MTPFLDFLDHKVNKQVIKVWKISFVIAKLHGINWFYHLKVAYLNSYEQKRSKIDHMSSMNNLVQKFCESDHF